MSPVPGPHEGPCKRCGSTVDVCRAGRYRGLCPPCRKAKAAEPPAEKNAAPPPRVSLSKTVQELVPLAEILEASLNDRKIVQMRARVAFRDFKEGLTTVQRAAQSLLNTTGEKGGD